MARDIVARSGAIPTDLKGLQELPGVGRYVASAFLVVVHGQSLATVDANVTRIIRRVFSGRPVGTGALSIREAKIAAQIVEASGDPRRISWALLDYGAMVCRSVRPRCTECEFSNLCRYEKYVEKGRR